MSHSLKKQHGVTAIGWLLILFLIGFFALIAMKLTPMYTEYWNIVSSLESTLEQENIYNESVHQIRTTIERKFSINDVKSITKRNVVILKSGGTLTLEVDYERREPLFGNVSIVVNFKKSLER